MEVQELGKFILEIGIKIEQISGATLNFPQECTVLKGEWISESEMTMLKSKGIHLRTAEQTQNMETVKLKLFDPFVPYECPSIPSCVAGRSETTPKPTCSFEENTIKQDSFRFKVYLESLTSFVSARCAQECVTLDVASFTKDDFNGYTSLIGELEKAFIHLNSKRLIGSPTKSLLAEVFLNTRNFLLITNSLLNSDEDNIAIVLGPYLKMFLKFLDVYSKNSELLPNVLIALQEVMNMVLLFFGVIYTWVFLTNPDGCLEGGIIGLSLALAGGVVHDLCPVKLFATSLVGLVAGNLIGSGGYDWYRNHHYMQMQQQIIQKYQQRGQPFARQLEWIYPPANADADF